MMQITLEQFKAIAGENPYAEHWIEALNKCLPDYDITTPERLAGFFGQCMVESAGFTAIKENLNYKAESLMRLWHSHFQTIEIANEYAHNPEKIANRAYAGRMGNGPEESGDGWAYCGRGLIQLTGKDNYQSFADSIGSTLQEVGAYLETFEGCVQSACWFWENNNLNALADQKNWIVISHKVNGGSEGQDKRVAFSNHALQVFST
jgi:putative chitinase